MKTFKHILLASILLAISVTTNSVTTNAKTVKTSAEALTLCKAEAKLAHPDYKKSKLKKSKRK